MPRERTTVVLGMNGRYYQAHEALGGHANLDADWSNAVRGMLLIRSIHVRRLFSLGREMRETIWSKGRFD